MSTFLTTLELDQARQMYRQLIKDQMARSSGYSHPAFEAFASSISGQREQADVKFRQALKALPLSPTEALSGLAGQVWLSIRGQIAALRDESDKEEKKQSGLGAGAVEAKYTRITGVGNDPMAARREAVKALSDPLQSLGEGAEVAGIASKAVGGVATIAGVIPSPATPALLSAGPMLFKAGNLLSLASNIGKGASLGLDFSSRFAFGGGWDKEFKKKAAAFAIGFGVGEAAEAVGKKVVTAGKAALGLGTQISRVPEWFLKLSPQGFGRALAIHGAKNVAEASTEALGNALEDPLASGSVWLFDQVKSKVSFAAELVGKGLGAARSAAGFLVSVITGLETIATKGSFLPRLLLSPFITAASVMKSVLIGFETAIQFGEKLFSGLMRLASIAKDAFVTIFTSFVDDVLMPVQAWIRDFVAKLQMLRPLEMMAKKAEAIAKGLAKIGEAVVDGVKKGAEFAKNAVVGGYNKVRGFGVSLFEKARDGLGAVKDYAIGKAVQAVGLGRDLVSAGVSKAREFGESLFSRVTSFGAKVKSGAVTIGHAVEKGASTMFGKAKGAALSGIGWFKKKFQTPAGLADGELSGPFLPFAHKWTPDTPDAEVAQDLAAVQASSSPAARFGHAVSGALVVINGVLNDPVSHARFVQSVADRHKTLSIGVYNATNSILDFVQYTADSLRMGKNPAVDALVAIIEQRKGKLNLFAHSHGTMITQRAYELAEKRGKLGDPSTVLRRYYGDAAGEADDDPNLTIYSNVNDYVSMLLGHGSIRSTLTNAIHTLTLGAFGTEGGRSAKTAYGYGSGDPHAAVDYAKSDPFDLDGDYVGSPDGKKTVQADVSGGGIAQGSFLGARFGSLALWIAGKLGGLGLSLVKKGGAAVGKGAKWAIQMGGKAAAYLKSELTDKTHALFELSKAVAGKMGGLLGKGVSMGMNAIKAASSLAKSAVGKGVNLAKKTAKFYLSKLKSGKDMAKEFIKAAKAKAIKKVKAMAKLAFDTAMKVKAAAEKAAKLALDIRKKAIQKAKAVASMVKKGVTAAVDKAVGFAVDKAEQIGGAGKAAAVWAADKVEAGYEMAKSAASAAADMAKSAADKVSGAWDSVTSWWGQSKEDGLGMAQPAMAAAGASGPAASALGGSALDPALARAAGRAFGADFSGVTVHGGEEAGQALSAMGARAMASGGSVFFAPGEFSAGGTAGLQLIGHELAHVVQQGRGGVDPAHLSSAGRAHFEREADEGAGEMVRSVRQAGQHSISSHKVAVQAADGASVARSEVSFLEGLMEVVHSRVIAKLAGREDLPKEIQSLSVRLECDVERMAASEIVETWAAAILQEIESEASRTALPAKLRFPARAQTQEGEGHHLMPESGQKQTVTGAAAPAPAPSQTPATTTTAPSSNGPRVGGDMASNDQRFRPDLGSITFASEAVEYSKGYETAQAKGARAATVKAEQKLAAAKGLIQTAEDKAALAEADLKLAKERGGKAVKETQAFNAAKSALKAAKAKAAQAEKLFAAAQTKEAKAEEAEKKIAGKSSRLLHWPANDSADDAMSMKGGIPTGSGLTLGAGYDMKLRTSEGIASDLMKAGVNESTAQSVARMNVIFRNRHELRQNKELSMKTSALIGLMNRAFSTDPEEAAEAKKAILPLYKAALGVEAAGGSAEEGKASVDGYSLTKDKKRKPEETKAQIEALVKEMELDLDSSAESRKPAKMATPEAIAGQPFGQPSMSFAEIVQGKQSPMESFTGFKPAPFQSVPGAAAQKLEPGQNISTGILSPEEQKSLFENIYPEYEQRARKAFGFSESEWTGLTQSNRDLLSDMAYQGLPASVDKTAMKKAMTSQDKKAMKAVLEAGYKDDARMAARKSHVDSMDFAPKKEAPKPDIKSEAKGEAP